RFGDLCYNPDIAQRTSLPDELTPTTTVRMSAQFLVPDYASQDTEFAQAFSLVESAISERVFPAATVVVTNRGRLVAHKGFGRFTYEKASAKVLPDTVFDLASVTKVVATTTMAMILYERGLLDLDLPVVSIVPEFSSQDSRRGDVTLRMLLAHSSGLPAY